MVAAPDHDRLCARLGYSFADPALLALALTHRSSGRRHNERLEFLGDSVLGCVISIMLYERFPDLPEGDLSRLRTRVVRGDTLAQVGAELGLGDYVALGEGARKGGGARLGSIRADALEAVLGAIYLDGGFAAAWRVIENLFGALLDDLPPADTLKDPKTRLQEHFQSHGSAPPSYQLIGASGPEHQRRFRVRCNAPVGDVATEASAGSRRRAEQAAARRMLERLAADSDAG